MLTPTEYHSVPDWWYHPPSTQNSSSAGPALTKDASPGGKRHCGSVVLWSVVHRSVSGWSVAVVDGQFQCEDVWTCGVPKLGSCCPGRIDAWRCGGLGDPSRERSRSGDTYTAKADLQLPRINEGAPPQPPYRRENLRSILRNREKPRNTVCIFVLVSFFYHGLLVTMIP
ncbi:hypothetical protein GEV33_008664 [Tenebrio molitor]|uniref:Uncharacterized protein n=1 Tax=Tenebrio molitor TaxID=7067 RepID=A0A8J6HH40_TENMO|nr:hypothetical protein GEV33_008664 [Tenebrio molitor]